MGKRNEGVPGASEKTPQDIAEQAARIAGKIIDKVAESDNVDSTFDESRNSVSLTGTGDHSDFSAYARVGRNGDVENVSIRHDTDKGHHKVGVDSHYGPAVDTRLHGHEASDYARQFPETALEHHATASPQLGGFANGDRFVSKGTLPERYDDASERERTVKGVADELNKARAKANEIAQSDALANQ